jgi:hypothetical protein
LTRAGGLKSGVLSNKSCLVAQRLGTEGPLWQSHSAV